MLEREVKRMGEDAALHLDTQIRNAIMSAAIHKLYAGAEDFQKLKEKDSKLSKLTMLNLLKCKTRLEISKARKFNGNNGSYIALVSPQGAFDLLQDESWQRVREYQDKEAIYNGELGRHMGMKVIQWDNGFIEGVDEGLFDKDGHIRTALVFGEESFATVDLTGKESLSSPLAPQFVYNEKPDKADILNQYKVVGWKGLYASTVLEPTHICAIRHKSTFE